MTQVDQRIHDVLDGASPRDTLPPELRAPLERLERAGQLLAAAPIAPSVEARVMALVRRRARPRVARTLSWLLAPRSVTLRFRPVWSLALAAVIALLTLVPSADSGPVVGEGEGVAQFLGRFPDAHSVHVVGSFNDWRTGEIPMEDRDHDGVWRVAVVLPTGVHEYMFVVDGERWVPDPLADRYVEDDFGRQNSVLIVRPLRR